MKAYDTSILFHAKKLKKKIKNPKFGQKRFLPRQNLCRNFYKMCDISGNT